MALTETYVHALRSRIAQVVDAHAPFGSEDDTTSSRSPSEPEHSDEAVRTNTGRGWHEWRAVIEAWPGHADGHAAVAAWLQAEHGVDGWWAQSVTVGWERISGRRLKYQVADGTFTVNRSATIGLDADAVRTLLRSDEGRDMLLPDLDPQLRSRPASKNIRVGLVAGVAEFAVSEKAPGRATVTVSHAKLVSPAQAERWRAFWGDWLDAVDVPGSDR